jgi:3-isopropylmalate/(R)-2-methylmalate dehydratase large subunit
MTVEELLQSAVHAKDGDTLFLDPTFSILNNKIAVEAIDSFEEQGLSLAAPHEVLVIQDKHIPPESPEGSVIQQKLARFALKHGTPYTYGQGMACHLCMTEYAEEGDVIFSCGRDIPMLGGIGALGLTISAEQMVRQMTDGVLAITPHVYHVKLEGKLPPSANIRDLGEMLVQALRDSVDKETIIAFRDVNQNLSIQDRMILCGWMQKLGVMSSVIVSNMPNTDYTIDMSNIMPHYHPGETDLTGSYTDYPIHAVFIGGAYGGFIEDIRTAAQLLKGRHVAFGMRFAVSPATADVYLEAIEKGYISTILEAGGIVLNQCALPESNARISSGEVMITNDIHNEKGYAGPDDSLIISASTYQAVMAGMTGKLTPGL